MLLAEFQPFTPEECRSVAGSLAKNAFVAGERVRKVGGSYQANGWIAAAFTTRTGEERYVFEFETPPGMLHIFREDQLKEME